MQSEKAKKEALLRCYKGVEPFIFKQANYLNSVCGADVDDLKQEGYFGVKRAYELYDPSNPSRASFFTYAQYWIKTYMQAYAYRFMRCIRVPEMYNFIYAAYIKRVDENGKPKTKEQFDIIAKDLNMQPDKLRKILHIMHDTESCSDIELSDESDNSTVITTLFDKSDNDSLIARVKNFVSSEEFFVVDHRLALTVPCPKTLEWIGKILGVSKERVRQIQKRALDKIKRAYEGGFF